MGLSNGAVANFIDLAAIVRFAPAGLIDARNGGLYQAATSILYSANKLPLPARRGRAESYLFGSCDAQGQAEQMIGQN